MDRTLSWLDDIQFARLAPHLPTDTGGKLRTDNRRVISGILHVLKCGCRWADAPEAYGPRETLHNRLLGGQRASLCLGRKRGERSQAIGRSRG
jgi:transposase